MPLGSLSNHIPLGMAAWTVAPSSTNSTHHSSPRHAHSLGHAGARTAPGSPWPAASGADATSKPPAIRSHCVVWITGNGRNCRDKKSRWTVSIIRDTNSWPGKTRFFHQPIFRRPPCPGPTQSQTSSPALPQQRAHRRVLPHRMRADADVHRPHRVFRIRLPAVITGKP